MEVVLPLSRSVMQSSHAIRTHIHLLDVLRGVAASLVVVTHVLLTVPGAEYPEIWTNTSEWWARNLYLGQSAVTLFFVLSGASLAMSAFHNPATFDARRFFVKRVWRIYPLYVLIILVYFCFRPVYHLYLAQGWVAPDVWLSPQFTELVTGATWFKYLTMSFNFFPIRGTFNNALWSLAVEMQFYLLFPLIFVILRRGRWQGLIGVLLFIGGLYAANRAFHANTMVLERAWEFAGGMIIGANWRRIGVFMKRRWIRLVVLGMLLILFEVSRYPLPIRFIPSNTLEVFFCLLLVALAVSFECWQPRRAVARLLVNIGVWSFSLYLVHNLVIGGLTPILKLTGLTPVPYFLVALILVYSVSLLLSRYLYIYFERPFMKLGSRYSRTRTTLTV